MEIAGAVRQPLALNPCSRRAGLGWPADGVFCGPGCHAAAGAIILAGLLLLPATAALGADFYLEHLGPPPLRFAPAPAKPQDFPWLAQIRPARPGTNTQAVAGATNTASGTNSVALAPSVLVPPAETNSPAAAQPSETTTASTPSPPGSMGLGLDGNPLSASNLLVVTPQMLADYFKAIIDTSLKASTNAPSGTEIPFNPPTPKTSPSSEAVYRTQ